MNFAQGHTSSEYVIALKLMSELNLRLMSNKYALALGFTTELGPRAYG